jgi:hypothetical protein
VRSAPEKGAYRALSAVICAKKVLETYKTQASEALFL